MDENSVPLLPPLKQVSEKTTENSERLGRKVRRELNPAPPVYLYWEKNSSTSGGSLFLSKKFTLYRHLCCYFIYTIFIIILLVKTKLRVSNCTFFRGFWKYTWKEMKKRIFFKKKFANSKSENVAVSYLEYFLLYVFK